MSEKKIYKLNILGTELTLKSEDSKEHVDAVLNFVNQKVSEIQSKSKTLPLQMVAILCALNIADELIKIQKEKNMTFERYSAKISRLNEEIAEALK